MLVDDESQPDSPMVVKQTGQFIENQFLLRLGTFISQSRLRLHLSQTDLALEAQIHKSYLDNIESGQRNVTVLTLIRIAHALKTSTYKILRAVEIVSEQKAAAPGTPENKTL